MSSSVLLLEKNEGVATVTLNRPNAMNALSAQLRSELAEVFDELASDAEIRVAILTGAGRAFCAGIDLKELGSGASEDAAGFGGRNPVRAMARFEGPIIGAINGHAITGGFELALACDILLASGNAKFADTHARVGILPGWGLSQRLSRLIGIGRAKEISLTGNFVTAERAEAWGLVNRVVAADDLIPTAQGLARDICSCDPSVMRSYKRLIDEGYAMPFGDAMEYEAKLSRESSSAVTAGSIEERREAIVRRGRSQDG
jgi:enoyl-CoA hydratase